jgi:hypothetical protein
VSLYLGQEIKSFTAKIAKNFAKGAKKDDKVPRETTMIKML